MIKDTVVPQCMKDTKNKTKTATNHVTLVSWLGGGAFGKGEQLAEAVERMISVNQVACLSPLWPHWGWLITTQPVDGAKILSVLPSRSECRHVREHGTVQRHVGRSMWSHSHGACTSCRQNGEQSSSSLSCLLLLEGRVGQDLLLRGKPH